MLNNSLLLQQPDWWCSGAVFMPLKVKNGQLTEHVTFKSAWADLLFVFPARRWLLSAAYTDTKEWEAREKDPQNLGETTTFQTRLSFWNKLIRCITEKTLSAGPFTWQSEIYAVSYTVYKKVLRCHRLIACVQKPICMWCPSEVLNGLKKSGPICDCPSSILVPCELPEMVMFSYMCAWTLNGRLILVPLGSAK